MIASANAGKQNWKGEIKGVISLFADRIGQSAGGIYNCESGRRGAREAVVRWTILRSRKRPERVNRNEQRVEAKAMPTAMNEVADRRFSGCGLDRPAEPSLWPVSGQYI